jgi:hypothetical protein
MKWYRIVLDEAQFIRNRATRSSRSVSMLRAKYRWSLTGTPVTNTLVDVYGLLRFGRFRPWNDWTSFDEYIGRVMESDTVLAGMRAQEVLKPVLLRRTKATKAVSVRMPTDKWELTPRDRRTVRRFSNYLRKPSSLSGSSSRRRSVRLDGLSSCLDCMLTFFARSTTQLRKRHVFGLTDS